MGSLFSKCLNGKDKKSSQINKNDIEESDSKKKMNEDEQRAKEEELLRKEQDLQDKNEKILQKGKELSDKKKELTKKEKELNDKDEKLSKIRKELTEKKEELSEKEKQLNEKDKQIKEKEKLQDQSNKNKEFEQNNKIKEKEKENELNKKENELKDKEKEFEDNYIQKIKEIDLKKKSFNEIQLKKDEENKKRANELKDLEEKINAKDKEINQNKELFLIQKKNEEKKIKEQSEKIQKDLEKLNNEKKEFEKKKELEKKPFKMGLNNIGATCYMNSTLQALSNTDKLTNYFLEEFNYNPNDMTKKMSNEYYKVLTNLWDKKKKEGSYSPNDFKNVLSNENPLFAGVQANDSKDLINFLLERFHNELNVKNNSSNVYNYNVNQLDEQQTFNSFFQDFRNNYNSIISAIFYGIIETKTKCSLCNNIKYNFQVFSFLEFPLEQVNIFCFQNGRRISLEKINDFYPDIDLMECFEYNQKAELMCGNNQMYCNICNTTANAFYQTLLYSLPLYLIINLNRGKNAVYQCNVNFPEQINLLNYVYCKNGVTTYNLYAVICHYGPSSMSGHFIAYCRNRIDNKWYSYNDSIVTLCTDEKPYKNGMPYILFYKSA